MAVTAVDYYCSNQVSPEEYFSWWQKIHQRLVPLATDITQMILQKTTPATFAQPGTLVELGCGPGNSFPIAAKELKLSRVIAVDVSEQMLAYVRKHGQRHPFSISTLKCNLEHENLNIPLASCNIVMACSVMDYIKNIEHVFKQVSQILLPGGLWCFDSFTHKGSSLLETDSENVTHYVHSMSDIMELSKRYGFTEYTSSVYPFCTIVQKRVSNHTLLIFQKK